MSDSSYTFEIPREWPFGRWKNILEIDESGVKYKGSFISSNEYEALSLRLLQYTRNFLREGTYREITISGGNKEIKIEFDDAFYGKFRGKLYETVLPTIMDQVGSRIFENIKIKLLKNIDVAIGGAIFGIMGAQLFERTSFFGSKGKLIFVPYERLRYSITNGTIQMSDSLHRNLDCSFPYYTENGWLIDPLLNFLRNRNK